MLYRRQVDSLLYMFSSPFVFKCPPYNKKLKETATDRPVITATLTRSLAFHNITTYIALIATIKGDLKYSSQHNIELLTMLSNIDRQLKIALIMLLEMDGGVRSNYRYLVAGRKGGKISITDELYRGTDISNTDMLSSIFFFCCPYNKKNKLTASLKKKQLPFYLT